MEPGMKPLTSDNWEVVIGLEVHCQLRTQTKIFCGCANRFGAEPNSLTCAVCSGQPGAMPVFNRAALELAVRVGLGVGADIAPRSTFDRKNYFYCDLPKGYQITQFAQPYCSGGGIQLSSGKFVRLTRIHLEEDAGKAIHDRGQGTLVDLNRAGVPLIESVTEADMSSAAEAVEYLTALKEILEYTGASDCDMEKGSLRCDVNISVRHPGEELRTKVEIKNLNSFRHIQSAIDFEVQRQMALYESDGKVVQETRLWDPDKSQTRTMRGKEDAHDYRYFPEPDLPAMGMDAAAVEAQRQSLPELPAKRRARFQSECGLSAYDAGVLCASRELADYFERTAELCGDPKQAANWIANDVLSAIKETGGESRRIAEFPIDPENLAAILKLQSNGTLNRNAAKQVFTTILEKGGDPAEVVRELGLEQVSDAAELESWCRTALEGREAIAADVRAGKLKALGALMGPVMAASRGKADPAKVREIFIKLIQAE